MRTSLGAISDKEILQIIGLEKYLAADVEWHDDPEHSAMKIFTARLLDPNGASIPELSVEFGYRTPARYDACLYQFTLFSFRPGGEKRRVYQIEVVPSWKTSHQDANGAIRGPHQHFGDAAAELPHKFDAPCRHHEAWFRMFLDNAKIGFGHRYISPFEGSLFPP